MTGHGQGPESSSSRRRLRLSRCAACVGAVVLGSHAFRLATSFCGSGTPGPRPVRISMRGAKSVIEGMYAAVNARDLEGAMKYIDESVVYEDFTFQEPFKGRAGVQKLFEEAFQMPKGLDFVIDSTAGGEGTFFSDEDSIGMTWHVEFDGVPLPNGRGASLYRTKGDKLVYARDVVESPLKLGSAALGIVGFIAPIIRALRKGSSTPTAAAELEQGAAETPQVESSGSWTTTAFAVAAAVYWYVLLLSPPGQFPFLNGPPAWAIDATTLKNVVDESLDFFYIWPGLEAAGLPSPTTFLGTPVPVVEPLRLALFNFSEAYALLFLPLLMWDRPKNNVYPWWGFGMFLTNAIFLPYFATTRGESDDEPRRKPSWAPAFGLISLIVAAVALWQGYNLLGGFGALVLGDRVAFAFMVDCICFSILQAYVFSSTAGPAWRLIPFFGLVAWLLLPESEDDAVANPQLELATES